MLSTSFLLSILETFISKLSEAVASEAFKRSVLNSKSKQAKQLLLSLFDDMSILENSARKFVELLESYIEKEKHRQLLMINDELKDRWHFRWSQILLRQIKEVEGNMHLVRKGMGEKASALSIYVPEVVDLLKNWDAIIGIENYMAFSVGISDMEQHEELLADENIDFDEFCILTLSINRSVNALGQAKTSLASLIKDNFSFSELL